jgi:hypothetical protein
MSKNIESQGMRDATVGESSATGSWDPYEVWLNRVKKPREDQAVATQTLTGLPAARQAIKVPPADVSDTQRLRALTISG